MLTRLPILLLLSYDGLTMAGEAFKHGFRNPAYESNSLVR